jgi:hypothetical protein
VELCVPLDVEDCVPTLVEELVLLLVDVEVVSESLSETRRYSIAI